eukprot:4776777-Amphidinium_carterae.1
MPSSRHAVEDMMAQTAGEKPLPLYDVWVLGNLSSRLSHSIITVRGEAFGGWESVQGGGS